MFGEIIMNKQIHALSFALAFGVVWGIAMFIIGILGWLCGFGLVFIELFGSVYIGFAPTFIGSIIGLFFGFCDAFIGGFILAILYNFFVKKCCKE